MILGLGRSADLPASLAAFGCWTKAGIPPVYLSPERKREVDRGTSTTTDIVMLQWLGHMIVPGMEWRCAWESDQEER